MRHVGRDGILCLLTNISVSLEGQRSRVGKRAATAAAAASSRISSFRKDSFDDSAQQEVINLLFSEMSFTHYLSNH